MSGAALVQPITLDGNLVASVIAGGRAIIRDGLPEHDLPTVRAMCLFALRVQSGEQPGPYSDVGALEYAQRASERVR